MIANLLHVLAAIVFSALVKALASYSYSSYTVFCVSLPTFLHPVITEWNYRLV